MKAFLKSTKQAYVSSLSQFPIFNVTVQIEDMILAAMLFTRSYMYIFLCTLLLKTGNSMDKMDTYACFVDVRKALTPYQENMCMVHH